jgi:hypothetical protein
VVWFLTEGEEELNEVRRVIIRKVIGRKEGLIERYLLNWKLEESLSSDTDKHTSFGIEVARLPKSLS